MQPQQPRPIDTMGNTGDYMAPKIVRCGEGVFAHEFGDTSLTLHSVAKAHGATRVVPLGKELHKLEFVDDEAARMTAHPIAIALGKELKISVFYESGERLSRFGISSATSEPRSVFSARRSVGAFTAAQA